MTNEIRQVTVQVAPPSRNNPNGVVDICGYTVEGDTIVPVDDDGKRLAKPIKLNGKSPDDVARKYLRDRNLKARGSDFNKPINYGPEPNWR